MVATARPYSGYHRVSDAREDPELTHTGPRTPCGEYFRRFWIPVAMTEELGEHPTPLTVLGEDLVLFRDLSGRLGLLHRHCSHRRASLEYGIVSERGIRCCYHGWLFDVDGTILEAPGEPAESPIPSRLCHGAYPVTELAGLVFAYLGPPELRPGFPRLDTLSLPGGELVPYAIDYPCNWLQVAENPMDPFHSVFLHTRVPARTSTRRGARCRWSSGTRARIAPASTSPTCAAGRASSGCAPPRSCSPPSRSRRTSTRTRTGRSSSPASVSPSGRCRSTIPGAGSSATATSARSSTSTQGRSSQGRAQQGGLRRPDRNRTLPEEGRRMPATTRRKCRRARSRSTPASGSRPPTRA